MASSAELCSLFAHARITDDDREPACCSENEACSLREPSFTERSTSDVESLGTTRDEALASGDNAYKARHPQHRPVGSSYTRSEREVRKSQYPEVPLRDYQLELYDAVQAKWQNEKAAALLAYLPTGGGKTHVAAALMSHALSRGEACCCLFVVNRRCLVEQTICSLLKLGFPAAAASSIVGEAEERADAVIQVASIQSLSARYLKQTGHGAILHGSDDDETSLAYVDRVGRVTVPPACARGAFHLGRVSHCFIDEAHAAGAQTYRRLMRALPSGARVLGLTATPFRSDAEASLKDAFPQALFGPSVSQLIARALLVPPAVFGPAISKYVHAKASRGATRAHAPSDSLSAATERSLHEAVEAWTAHGGGLPTVAFCARVAESRRLCALLCAAGVAAAHVDGGTGATERRRLVAALRRREVEVLCNCDVLSEGFDEPSVACVVLLDHVHTESRRLYIQQVGRALRPAPGKARCVVIDCVGATWHHGPITGPIGSDYKHIQGCLRLHARSQWEEQLCSASGRGVSKLIRRCECGALQHVGVGTCAGCGADVQSRRRRAVCNAKKADSVATEESRKPLAALPLNRYRIPKKGGPPQQDAVSIPSVAHPDRVEMSLPDLSALRLTSDSEVAEGAALGERSELTAEREAMKPAAHVLMRKTEAQVSSLQSSPARSQPLLQPQLPCRIIKGPRPEARPVIAASSLRRSPPRPLQAHSRPATTTWAQTGDGLAHPDAESQASVRAHAQSRESTYPFVETVKQSQAREAAEEKAPPLPANPTRKAHAQEQANEQRPLPPPQQQQQQPSPPTRAISPSPPPTTTASRPPPPPKTMRSPSRKGPESMQPHGGNAGPSAHTDADSVPAAGELQFPKVAIRQDRMLLQSSMMAHSVPPAQQATTVCKSSTAAAPNETASAEPRRERSTNLGVDEIEAMLGATLSLAPRSLHASSARSEATPGGRVEKGTEASADAPRGAFRPANRNTETLPPYWVRAWSATRQREYFFHTRTREKTWHFPTTTKEAENNVAQASALSPTVAPP